MGKMDEELIKKIDELNDTINKIKLTTDVLEGKLFNKRNPIVIEKNKKVKSRWEKIRSILLIICRVLMFNVFIPGIVVFMLLIKWKRYLILLRNQ